MINDYNIQVAAVNKTMDFMGSDFWMYEVGNRKRYKWRSQLMKEVREACAFRISYSTLRRWICYYQKYGEVPAKSRRHRPTIKGQRTVSDCVLPANYKETLKKITEEKPQLYLDEIQVEVFHRTGKLFSPSSISRHLRTINYSLKIAVLRAKQQKEEEVNAYHIRMAERLEHPSQLLFIDESARDELASRRTRAYSPVGITPIVVAPMVRDFYSRYTFLGACNWEGFIREACTIVEREHGKDDVDPN